MAGGLLVGFFHIMGLVRLETASSNEELQIQAPTPRWGLGVVVLLLEDAQRTALTRNHAPTKKRSPY
jgi:hypothetical protein